MNIIINPIGEISDAIITSLAGSMGNVFGCPVEIVSPLKIQDRAFEKKRNQYLASALLDELKKQRVSAQSKVLGVADVDIFMPDLNFVFGLAEIHGNAAVISVTRLRQEFYGLPQDEGIFRDRTVKEAVHELGHTFGLSHCSDNTCVMHFSNSLHDTDIKGVAFCSGCQPGMVK